jgi:16S rRNA (guanine966-N2)-methyltransferase
MPRIISGKAGGIRLESPAGSLTRPTSDRVKEALFSILALRIPDSRVLDLYSGSGQLGIEAVSRGAAFAVLVDNDRASLECIQTNIARSGLAGLEIWPGDVFRVLKNLSREERKFDLVFLDPPYRMAAQTLERAASALTGGLAGRDPGFCNQPAIRAEL